MQKELVMLSSICYVFGITIFLTILIGIIPNVIFSSPPTTKLGATEAECHDGGGTWVRTETSESCTITVQVDQYTLNEEKYSHSAFISLTGLMILVIILFLTIFVIKDKLIYYGFIGGSALFYAGQLFLFMVEFAYRNGSDLYLYSVGQIYYVNLARLLLLIICFVMFAFFIPKKIREEN